VGLAELADPYSIDLTSYPDLSPYYPHHYRARAFAELQGMPIRQPAASTG